MGMRRMGWAEDGKNERSVGMCGCRKDTCRGAGARENGKGGCEGLRRKGVDGGRDGKRGKERETVKEGQKDGGTEEVSEGWRDGGRHGETD